MTLIRYRVASFVLLSGIWVTLLTVLYRDGKLR